MNVNSILNRFVTALAGGQASYEERLAGGVKATGSILFDANPSEDDTITLGDLTLTFKATPDAQADEVDIGVDLGTTIDNIITKIATYDADAYVRQATYTNTGPNTTLTVTWNTHSTAGNYFTLASSDEANTVTAMTGGVDGALDVDKGVTVVTDSVSGADSSFDLPAPDSDVVQTKTILLAARSEAQDVVVYVKGGNAMTLTFDAAKEYANLVAYGGSWYSVGGTATAA